jgi:glutathione S-transferase
MGTTMTYTLLIADKSYSSWSLRGWLSFRAFDIPVTVKTTRMYCDQFRLDLEAFAPGCRTVPIVRTPTGGLLTESIAIAWHLERAFPDRGLLPADAIARARAMSLVAEMHSGFTGLRGACPMNLRTGWEGVEVTDAIKADLERLEQLWGAALEAHGGPWLCGDYSLADVFFAPVATRILTYDLPVSDRALAYARAHVAHPAFRRWRAMGLVEGPEQPAYEMDLPRRPFPAPTPLAARAVDHGPSENATCPYSGDPVRDFMELDGRVFGFCNPSCRDKTVADPDVWPDFMAIYQT